MLGAAAAPSAGAEAKGERAASDPLPSRGPGPRTAVLPALRSPEAKT